LVIVEVSWDFQTSALSLPRAECGLNIRSRATTCVSPTFRTFPAGNNHNHAGRYLNIANVKAPGVAFSTSRVTNLALDSEALTCSGAKTSFSAYPALPRISGRSVPQRREDNTSVLRCLTREDQGLDSCSRKKNRCRQAHSV